MKTKKQEDRHRHAASEARVFVVSELLRWAQMLRKNGSPQEAKVAAEYEELLESDRQQAA